MFAESVDVLLTFIRVYGLPALFIVFFIEGILLGKIIPPILVIPSALLIFGDGLMMYGVLLIVCAIGSTAGQYALYKLIDKHGIEFVYETRYIPLNEEQINKSIGWFDEWGNVSVTIGHSLPFVRGVMTIPAAMSNTGERTFPLYAFVGNVTYHGVIILFSLGLLSFLPIDNVFDMF